MFNHEPEGYQCPFCFLLDGGDTELDDQRDVVLRTDRATALVASTWWRGNEGHVLVIPNAHHENVYDLPAEYGHAVHDVVRLVAVALRTAYPRCAGISTRQHNEPAGTQHVWHHHVHVVPRYEGDDFPGAEHRTSTIEERLPYVGLLRRQIAAG
ncbi:HIT family protein [Umezawaea tangerina]|uniref:Histidine triad (HIT) family protein n=1 Tax=Umezawaea tangerina TaxID=84725 RepID=A0A2T0SRP6_9PSEU|nr:HIT domain-containing protein [Umezawaea tangerina]PRY36092.1 histidine triad (HIT) family protein [Umezawaea tangerina]